MIQGYLASFVGHILIFFLMIGAGKLLKLDKPLPVIYKVKLIEQQSKVGKVPLKTGRRSEINSNSSENSKNKEDEASKEETDKKQLTLAEKANIKKKTDEKKENKKIEKKLENKTEKKEDKKEKSKQKQSNQNDVSGREGEGDVVASGNKGDGGIISLGGGGEGKISLDGSDFQFPYYLNLVTAKVGKYWECPYGAGKGEGVALVYFKIMRNGSAVDIKVEVSSGNVLFDQAALRAVTMCIPFPPLPQGFFSDELGVHFEFRFTGKSIG